MRCLCCGKDEMYKDTTSEAIEMEFGLLVIRNIPCMKCVECDEVFISGSVIKRIEDIVEKVKLITQDVAIIDYQKTA